MSSLCTDSFTALLGEVQYVNTGIHNNNVVHKERTHSDEEE